MLLNISKKNFVMGLLVKLWWLAIQIKITDFVLRGESLNDGIIIIKNVLNLSCQRLSVQRKNVIQYLKVIRNSD